MANKEQGVKGHRRKLIRQTQSLSVQDPVHTSNTVGTGRDESSCLIRSLSLDFLCVHTTARSADALMLCAVVALKVPE